MEWNKVRMERVENQLNYYISNESDFKELIRQKNLTEVDVMNEVRSIVFEIVFGDNYLLDKKYLDCSWLEVHPTPKTSLIIDIDSVWEWFKEI